MKRFLMDMGVDLAGLVARLVHTATMVAFTYTLVNLATDLAHDQALEVSLLLGGVVFFSTNNGSRVAQDVKHTVKMKVSRSGLTYDETDSRKTK